MNDRCAKSVRFLLFGLVLAVAAPSAAAQATSSSSLSGVVVDAEGGPIPGAPIAVKNNATDVVVNVVSGSSGRFRVPGLDAGTYAVTVSLTGFKTLTIRNVRLVAARDRSIVVKLEVGAEAVEVDGGSNMELSQSPTVSSTLLADDLNALPLVSRNALYSLSMLPGVSASGDNFRNAIINGLPNNTLNITIDGISTGNAFQSGDGFYSMVTPRLDAVQEVTLTAAVPPVNAGSGSVQAGFVTRSGGNQFDGSAYLYWRDPKLNSNYFFNEAANLPKNDSKLRTWGARIGGPIVRGKAFYFLNYEQEHRTTSATRTRTVLNSAAQQGIFTYDSVVGGVITQRQVNLLDEARKRGYTSTTNSTIASMLGLINQATASRGAFVNTTDPNLRNYVFQSESIGDQFAPTGRLDYNLTNKHRVTGTFYRQRFESTADLLNNRDASFPGMPNHAGQESRRTMASLGLRSTLTSNMVNEFKAGFEHAPIELFSDASKTQFDNMGGYAIVMPLVTNIWTTNDPQRRNTTTWSVSDDLHLLKGAHGFTFGASFSGAKNRQSGFNLVPELGLGLDPNDPAAAMFNSVVIAGASDQQLAQARDLYALLTGRVTSVGGTARLDASGKYVYLGDVEQKFKASSMAAYAYDSWRVRPTLTLTAGLRWDVQRPFTPASDNFSTVTTVDLCGVSGVGGANGRACKLFAPGTVGGKAQPTYVKFAAGDDAYETKWKNLGYVLGFAWRPNVQGGLFRSILGDPEQATVHVGYSLAYNVERLDRFNAGNNPGATTPATRNNTTSSFCLVCGSETWPVLISDKNLLGPALFPQSLVYPIAANASTRMDIMSPDLRTPRVQSYSAGIQRALGADTALEVRYVGNRSKYTWASENWNERIIFENGFYDEFLLARANLAFNVANKRGNTFAYTGAGTSPLPIHQAYLSGRSGADVTNPASYTASQYSNAEFLQRFSIYRPDVSAAAAAIDTTAFRANALTAGIAANFFVMNPSVASANVMMDGGATKYNSIQAELRRRLSKGLMVSANYTYARQYQRSQQTLRFDAFEVNDTQQPHEFKMAFAYALPLGKGFLGNWEVSGNARVQMSRFRISNAKLVGMTASELSREFKSHVYKDPVTGTTTVYSLPADIILNTRAAYSVDPTQPNGYSAALGAPSGRYIKPSSDASCVAIYRGDCNAPDIEINGPLYKKVDLRLRKAFPFLTRGSLEVNIEALNAFANVNFNHNLTPGAGAGAFQVTSAQQDFNTSGDPGGRVGQIVFRINW